MLIRLYKTIFILIVISFLSVCSSTEEKDTKQAKKDAKTETPAKEPAAATRAGGDGDTAKTAAPDASKTSPDADDNSTTTAAPKETAKAATRSGGSSNSGSGLRSATGGIDASTVVPIAKPGQCFSKVSYPAQYQEITEEYIKTPASEKVEIIPAQYELVKEKVLVKPATVRYEEVPATYETVEDKIEVKPAMKKITEYPAVYEMVEEKIIEKEGYSTWKKSDDNNLLCLVEVPPVYKTIQKQVLKTPATKKEEIIPAEYKVVKRVVEKTPPSTRKVEIPAEYQTITTKKLVEPEKQVKIPIPAEYDSVTRNVLVRDAVVDWKRVLCENNATPEKITEIQNALKTAGFDPGRNDGQADAKTFDALHEFQKSKNLPQDTDKYINIETVQALGLSID